MIKNILLIIMSGFFAAAGTLVFKGAVEVLPVPSSVKEKVNPTPVPPPPRSAPTETPNSPDRPRVITPPQGGASQLAPRSERKVEYRGPWWLLHEIFGDYYTVTSSEKYELGKIYPWTPDAEKFVNQGHKAFVHFTGEGCLDCKFQWALINLNQLKSQATKEGVLLFEANIIPGGDNSFISSQLEKNHMGGVPGYLFINSKGKAHILKERLWSGKELLKNISTLE